MQNKVNYRFVLISVPLLLMLVSLLILSISIGQTFYQSAFEEKKVQLLTAVKSRAKLIESLSKNNNLNSTLHHLISSQGEQRILGKSAEILLLEKDGSDINLLMNLIPSSQHEPVSPLSLENGYNSIPVQRSFYEADIMSSLDDRGNKVLAAFSPVHIGNETFGLVAKINSNEFDDKIIASLKQVFLLTFFLLIGFAFCQLFFIRPFLNRLNQQRENIQEIIDSTNHGIFMLDIDLNLSFFNRACCDISGFSHAEFQQQWQLFLPDQADLKNALQEIIHFERGKFKTQIYCQRKDGETRLLSFNARLKKNNGAAEGIVCSIDDITDKKKKELQLLTLSRAVEQGASSVFITNLNGEIEYINPQFTKITGYQQHEVMGKTPHFLYSTQALNSQHQNLLETIHSGKDWSGEILNIKKDGNQFWARKRISPVKNKLGEITHFVSISDDVTEEKNNQETMIKMAFYDPLTGLANRRLFRAQLNRALNHSKTNLQQCTALLLLDLDKFKRINDTLGHEAGDQILIETARRINTIVGGFGLVARLGGDEFIILLTHIDKIDKAGSIAEQIIQALKRPICIDQHDIIITTSIGITIAPEDGTDESELLKNADLAMYRSKDEGRNNYHFFTPQMQQEAHKRLSIENDLREAIIEQQFELYIQPKFNLNTKEIIGGEALIRWRHPEKGLISPIDFIPVAEDTGLIITIGQWIIDKAFQQIKQLNRNNNKPLGISINLSAQQLNDPTLVNFIRERILAYEISPTQIEFEITETLLMHNIENAAQMMSNLKKLGVKISIDDFGTGYSSLNYLKRLPFDTLKIDRSFVSGLPDDNNDKAIISSVILMAQKMAINIIAEGIETSAQFETLKKMGCSYGQGYLFAKPMPFKSFLGFIDKQNVLAFRKPLKDVNYS